MCGILPFSAVACANALVSPQRCVTAMSGIIFLVTVPETIIKSSSKSPYRIAHFSDFHIAAVDKNFTTDHAPRSAGQ